MSFWDRVKSILNREAADVREGMRRIGRTLDVELARRERELSATPTERLDMILEDIDADADRIQEIERTLHPGGEEPGPKRRAAPTHQLFTRSEMASGSRFDDAFDAVGVTYETLTATGHTHSVRIDEERLGDAPLDPGAVTADLADHTLVDAADLTNDGAIMVNAPNLHVEDVRLLTARAIAQQLS